jgi:signal transduction histidine kinase
MNTLIFLFLVWPDFQTFFNSTTCAFVYAHSQNKLQSCKNCYTSFTNVQHNQIQHLLILLFWIERLLYVVVSQSLTKLKTDPRVRQVIVQVLWTRIRHDRIDSMLDSVLGSAIKYQHVPRFKIKD